MRRLVEHPKESLEGQSVVINTDSKNVLVVFLSCKRTHSNTVCVDGKNI